MSPVRVTFMRTVGRTRNLFSSALSLGVFLSASALLFALGLEASEGGVITLAAVWASSVAPVLPILVAVLAMDVWSDERLSGRIDFLLSAPVKERDLVAGKFLGVAFSGMAAVVASLVVCVAVLRHVAPQSLAQVRAASFVPAFIALFLQNLLWSAVSVTASALFRHAAAAACVSAVLTCGLPRGFWAALIAWAPQGREICGEMPLDAHVLDMSQGVFALGVAVSYVALAMAVLFICAKCVESLRLVGRGAAKSRWLAALLVVLALVLSWLSVTLFTRIGGVVEFMSSGSRTTVSKRTLGILAESSGEITVTTFLPRSDTRFRQIGHMLRTLRRESIAHGGADIELRYVDPRWDLGPSKRLVGSGVNGDAVIFERGRRRLVVPLSSGFNERLFSSAILTLTMPQHRNMVYWTVGHGEASFSDYGAFGMSDIARELSRDGFKNVPLELSYGKQVPDDCALVIVAGAKEAFSLSESDTLDSYLKRGGRILVLAGKYREDAFASTLSAWGVRLSKEQPVGAKTLSGSDILAPVVGGHAITSPLAETQVVMERPLSLEPSAALAASSEAGEFYELVRAGGKCLAAVVERGNVAGQDLAIRPTRIAVIGDSLFAMNGQLESRGNANRDFFLNCVAHLVGTGALTSGGDDGDRLVTGMDRKARIAFVQTAVVFVPAAVVLLMLANIQLRRRRT